MHPYDRYFYDLESHDYTVSTWIADLDERYGGNDAVLVWPTYTNIGIDDRNQYEQIWAIPGGIDKITAFSAELEEAGVRVLWPYNPWDTGTHRSWGDDEEMLAWLVNITDTDGFNGDTMGSVPESFYNVSVEYGHPSAMEAEGGGSVESTKWTVGAPFLRPSLPLRPFLPSAAPF